MSSNFGLAYSSDFFCDLQALGSSANFVFFSQEHSSSEDKKNKPSDPGFFVLDLASACESLRTASRPFS